MTGAASDDARQARLAAALRENLKRRKAQARERRAEETAAPDPDAAAMDQQPRGGSSRS